MPIKILFKIGCFILPLFYVVILPVTNAFRIEKAKVKLGINHLVYKDLPLPFA